MRCEMGACSLDREHVNSPSSQPQVASCSGPPISCAFPSPPYPQSQLTFPQQLNDLHFDEMRTGISQLQVASCRADFLSHYRVPSPLLSTLSPNSPIPRFPSHVKFTQPLPTTLHPSLTYCHPAYTKTIRTVQSPTLPILQHLVHLSMATPPHHTIFSSSPSTAFVPAPTKTKTQTWG